MVVHSLTKFVSGASDIIAGVVCGSAAFVAANVVMGMLLTRAPSDIVIIWIGTAALLIAWNPAPGSFGA